MQRCPLITLEPRKKCVLGIEITGNGTYASLYLPDMDRVERIRRMEGVEDDDWDPVTVDEQDYEFGDEWEMESDAGETAVGNIFKFSAVALVFDDDGAVYYPEEHDADRAKSRPYLTMPYVVYALGGGAESPETLADFPQLRYLLDQQDGDARIKHRMRSALNSLLETIYDRVVRHCNLRRYSLPDKVAFAVPPYWKKPVLDVLTWAAANIFASPVLFHNTAAALAEWFLAAPNGDGNHSGEFTRDRGGMQLLLKNMKRMGTGRFMLINIQDHYMSGIICDVKVTKEGEVQGYSPRNTTFSSIGGYEQWDYSTAKLFADNFQPTMPERNFDWPWQQDAVETLRGIRCYDDTDQYDLVAPGNPAGTNITASTQDVRKLWHQAFRKPLDVIKAMAGDTTKSSKPPVMFVSTDNTYYLHGLLTATLENLCEDEDIDGPYFIARDTDHHVAGLYKAQPVEGEGIGCDYSILSKGAAMLAGREAKVPRPSKRKRKSDDSDSEWEEKKPALKKTRNAKGKTRARRMGDDVDEYRP